MVKRSVNNYRAMKHTSTNCTIDPREYNIGTANRENVQQFLGSMALYPFTERLGQVPLSHYNHFNLTYPRMPIQDVQLLVAQARGEADDPSLKVKATSKHLGE